MKDQQHQTFKKQQTSVFPFVIASRLSSASASSTPVETRLLPVTSASGRMTARQDE